MIDLRKLYVRPGDAVMPAWRRLLDWAKSFRLFAGPGVRLNRTPNGTYVVADVNLKPWDHPFKVRLSGMEATIGFGTVDGVAPRIGSKSIDVQEGEEPPKLKIVGKPNDHLRSWVVIDVKVEKGRDKIDPEDPQAVTVHHVRELEPEDAYNGRHPLAMLAWDSNKATVIRARQITHHNLGHIYVPDPDDRELPGRHFFWAV